MIILLLTSLAGIIVGILFERRNARKVERVLTEAEMIKEKGKALLDALKRR